MKKILLLLLIISTATFLNAQEAKKKSKKEKRAEKNAQLVVETTKLVESKNFVFKARTANPMGGRSVNLTTDYGVKVLNDSVYSYMPYYGRAYNAAYGSMDSPMTFDLPILDYSMEETKKGYRVKFGVKNASDRVDFSFQIMETGSTTLSVNSTNRQAITYNGNIEKIEEKK